MVNLRCELLFQVLVVDLFRGPVLKPGVPTPGIAPEFDVPHNVAASVLTANAASTSGRMVREAGMPALVSFGETLKWTPRRDSSAVGG